MNLYKMFIKGEWVDAVGKETFEDLNPYSGDLYAMVAKGDLADADKAMQAAFDARQPWSGTPPVERAKILSKAADLLEQKMLEFSQVLTLEGGGTVGKTMFEISQTVDLLRTAAADCKHLFGETFHTDPTKLSFTTRRPWGTVVGISPWNFPLILAMYKVAYGLAAGNTVVLKPASETPVIGLKIGELFQDAGLLPGALNIVTGPGHIIGDALIKDERCSYVTITGETKTGLHVAKTAASQMKKYTLELGGKNPLIVLSDVDMDFAVDTAAFSTFLHQGQICMSAGRVIVEEKIVEEFSQKLAAKAAGLAAGDPSEPSTVVGPLINDAQVKKVDGLVQEAVANGAELMQGGKYDGRVYQPTVLGGVNPAMRIYHEETFGPIASIISVKDEKEALRVANDTTYGLSAGLVTNDITKALYLAEGLEAGMVHVNNGSIDADAVCPFGGCKFSGQGREGGRYSLEAMTQVKWVTIQKSQKQYPF
jgi:acyl-CoA reductase-like NAD-dependent aldehyde dehydrogenase